MTPRVNGLPPASSSQRSCGLSGPFCTGQGCAGDHGLGGAGGRIAEVIELGGEHDRQGGLVELDTSPVGRAIRVEILLPVPIQCLLAY